MKYLNVNDCKARLLIERFIRGAKIYGKTTVDVFAVSQKTKLPVEQVGRILKEYEKNEKTNEVKI